MEEKSLIKKTTIFVIEYINKCKRVLKLLKYPTKQELVSSIKITFIGFLLIGFIGFLISLIMNNLALFK